MSKELEEKLRELRESLFVAQPALVDTVYPEKMRADVTLKAKKKINGEEKDPPQIYRVPISHHKSKDFMDRKLPKEGDPCWLVFFDREIDHLIEDLEKKSPEVDRVHDESDAILIGEWTADSEDIPSELGSMEPDDWLLGIHRGEGSRVYISNNGDIILHPGSSNQVQLVEDAQYSVPLFELLAQVFNTHTHPDPMSGTTGTPTTSLTQEQASDRIKVDN